MTDIANFPQVHALAVGCVFGAVVLASGIAVADEQPDCSAQLEQVPRDGSVIEVANPWLSYSGSVVYGGVVDPEASDVNLVGSQAFELSPKDAQSHVGIRLDESGAGDYQWKIRGGPEASFEIADGAKVDDVLPEMGDGEVSATLDLVVYEEFPVMYRQWELSFPPGSDDTTDAENMRYLVEFAWGEEDDEDGAESAKFLVTPTASAALKDPVVVELGGRADRCRHAEPDVPVTAETRVTVRAVDLAGNVSESIAEGEFEGVEAEKLAQAHEEFNRVIATLDTDDDAPTTEEMAEQMAEEEQAEEDSGGCSTTGSGGSNLVMILAMLALLGCRRRFATAL